MSTLFALITLLSSIVGLIAWWVKRKRSPTIDERKADNRQKFEDTFRNVYELRNQGNHAEADAMLKRLADAAASNIVRNVSESTFGRTNSDRQRLGDNAAKGESGIHFGKSDSKTSGSSSKRDEG